MFYYRFSVCRCLHRSVFTCAGDRLNGTTTSPLSLDAKLGATLDVAGIGGENVRRETQATKQVLGKRRHLQF